MVSRLASSSREGAEVRSRNRLRLTSRTEAGLSHWLEELPNSSTAQLFFGCCPALPESPEPANATESARRQQKAACSCLSTSKAASRCRPYQYRCPARFVMFHSSYCPFRYTRPGTSGMKTRQTAVNCFASGRSNEYWRTVVAASPGDGFLKSLSAAAEQQMRMLWDDPPSLCSRINVADVLLIGGARSHHAHPSE